MGFIIWIVLCMTVLFSARFALRPLGKDHKIKPFQSIDDFFVDKDRKE
ncbi:hypothetical protein KCQ59_13695 [Bacillus australimaris]|uniref:Uncharacterized protein n=1 Tax=Bacillus australimaris TaxID=1326968 RepID=A0ABD4QK51_9BACI|nr:hypothetical protein [Bacillus australimaris]MBR8690844.1 hypothetical protein [Bacillus australimaris]